MGRAHTHGHGHRHRHAHPLTPTATHGQPRPTTANHGHPRPPTAIHGHPRPPTVTHGHPRPRSRRAPPRQPNAVGASTRGRCTLLHQHNLGNVRRGDAEHAEQVVHLSLAAGSVLVDAAVACPMSARACTHCHQATGVPPARSYCRAPAQATVLTRRRYAGPAHAMLALDAVATRPLGKLGKAPAS